MEVILRVVKEKMWSIVIGSELVVLAGVLLLNLLSPLESYIVPVMSGTPDIGEIYREGGYYTFDQDGDAKAALELDDYIPFHISMPMKAGSYTVTLDYKSSSFSTLRLFSKSDAYAVQCDDFMMYENRQQLTSNLLIKHDVEDVDICVKYGGYGWFDVRGITLQGNHKDIPPLVCKWLCLFLVINFFLWIKRKAYTFANCEKLRVFLSLLFLRCSPHFRCLLVFYR